MEINSKEHMISLLDKSHDEFIPLLLRRGGKFQFISVNFEYQFQKEDRLAYFGKLE